MIFRFFSLVVCMMIMVGCTETNSDANPTLDVSGIQTILPTISPAEVEAYAELADEVVLIQGEALFESHCASCHGINGEGQFPDAPLQPDSSGRIGAPPHTGDGHTWHHPDDLLHEIIRFGGQGNPEMFYPMPGFGDSLTDAEIESILAFIKSMWTDEQRRIQAERTLTYRANFP